MTYNFKNLILKGGGVLGVAYVGALEELEKRNIVNGLERVGGASAGAIVATMIGLGYSVAEIKKELWAMDFKKFMDDSFGLIRDITRIVNHYGFCKGDYFENWIRELIRKKTGSKNSTFADIEKNKAAKKFRSLYIVGTNLSTRFSEIFSAETTPNMQIAEAVRISMSIPFVFAAKRIKGDVMSDGGVLMNYPIRMFDKTKYVSSARSSVRKDYYNKINNKLGSVQHVYNKETLGFRLSSADEIALFQDAKPPMSNEIKNLFNYIMACVMSIYQADNNSHLHSDDWARTVYINSLDISFMDFGLTEANKNRLIQSGVEGVQNYFKWYDDSTAKPNK